MSKVGGAILAVLGAVLLAGCGSGSGDKSTGPSAEQVINGNVKSAARSAVAKYATECCGDADARVSAAKAAGPSSSPEVLKAEAELRRWRDVLDMLRAAGGPEQMFQIKENKVGEFGADGATSRLVVDAAPAYQDMLGKQLSFDLHWGKVTRQSYDPVVRKPAYRTYWELRDSFLAKTAEEPGKKAGKE